MRAQLIRSAMVLVLLLGVPHTATANVAGFWRWLDRLSGPGPCTGVVYDQRLFSNGFQVGAQQTERTTFFDPGGLALDEARTSRPIMIGFQWGVLKCGNELPYEGRSAPTVWAFPLAGTVDLRVHRAVDAGASVGLTGFVGDDFTVWRPTVSPRVTIFPAAFVREPTRRHRALLVRVTASTILGELDAEDFDAVGDFKGGNEVLWGLSFAIDLLALRR
jgi:hypothetical protein